MASGHRPSSAVGSGENLPGVILPTVVETVSSDGCKPLAKVLQSRPPPPREAGEDDDGDRQDGEGDVSLVKGQRSRSGRIVKFIQCKIDQNPLHPHMEEVFLPRWMGPSRQRRVRSDLHAYQEQALARMAYTGIAEMPHTIQDRSHYHQF